MGSQATVAVAVNDHVHVHDHDHVHGSQADDVTNPGSPVLGR
jgi:hypothetical protein